MRRGRLVALAVLALVLGLVAAPFPTPASNAGPAGRNRPSQAAPGAEWTVMLYINGDNNLDASELQQVTTAAQARRTGKANVVVLIDRSPDAPRNGPLGDLGAFTDAKYLEVGEGTARVLKDMGEVDMGSPQTLGWFVHESITRYPAQHYSLSIVDHGGAWTGISWDDGTSTSQVSGDSPHLDMPGLAKGLATGLAGTGVDKLDVLSLTACLMATYEVAGVVAPYAHVMVAAEEISLSYFFDMGLTISRLEQGGATAEDLATTMIDSYTTRGEAQNGYGLDTQSFGAIDLDQFPQLRSQMRSFEASLLRSMGRDALPLARARADTLILGALEDPNIQNDFDQADLGDLLLQLGADGKASPETLRWAASLRQQIDRMVIHQRTGTATAAATGLTLYLPRSPEDARLDEYRGVTPGDRWVDVLSSYYRQLKADASTLPLRYAGDATVTAEDERGVQVAAPIDRDLRSILTEARLYVTAGLQSGGTAALIRQNAVITPGGRAEVAGGWDRRVFAVTGSDGQPVFVTALLFQTSEGFDVRVNGTYRSGEITDDHAQLMFTGESLDRLTLESIFFEDGSGGYLAVGPTAGATVVPNLAKIDGDEIKDVPVATEPLDVTKLDGRFLKVQPGTKLGVLLRMTDAAGRSAGASTTYTIP